ncbi:DNA polymerase I [Diplocloster agilis]|uniref:DNA polymerase I n=1 Tax=Diplocloster agilis TaxID=2850323 RepID=UPI000822989B|nr:DNA polymerase I [Suonthocola fibrivorans]MCU6735561.1 DNA polymerase I [Suonthocola fibrivorans]SCJ76930.1 DNA polymerase I%2C thermostable [uncultured Clostridium sp.]
MSEKIVLIDGHSILNRAFFGVPDLTNSDGLHTNAIYGFLNIMFKILEEEQADYLTVAFDVHAPTFRHEMFGEYKGTRKPMADELHQQVPVMKEVLGAMGIQVIEQAGYEADDLLGTISKHCEELGLDVSVVSGDRDLLQLATDKVKIRIPKTKRGTTEVEDYYAEDVCKRYQVTPTQFIDVKALMGDASDNIPGVPGIGEKTATKIIVDYGSIENAYEHVEEIKPNRAKEALRDHYDMAQMSKTLATICVDCDVPFSLDKAKLGELYTPEAYNLFKQLEFKNMLGRFHVEVPAQKVEGHFRKVTLLQDVEEVFQNIQKILEADSEKKDSRIGFVWIGEEEPLGLALACGDKEICYIPAEGFVTEEYLKEQLGNLIAKAAAAATLDLKSQLGRITLTDAGKERLFDCNIAAYLLNPLKDSYSYDDLAKEYLGMMIPSRMDLLGKSGWTAAQEEKPQEFLTCVCYMAYTAWRAAKELMEGLKDTDMLRLFQTVEMPLVYTLYDMEQAGILVQSEELKIYGEELGVRIAQLEQSIYQMAGEEFNINSPKQLGVVLFEHLKLPGGKKTKTGFSTAADVLEKLAPENEIVSLILEYRQLAKLKSTYADGLAAYIAADGRIHSTFNQTITATGRISSTEPNLQNIPIRMELGRLIRKVFIPAPGCVFIDADYSQIELRVLAHMSEDENLIHAYREAADIHRMTASQVFHTPFDEVSPQQRSNAKAVNFGIVYGISSFGLSQGLSITRKEAADYIGKYFETYPGVKKFLDNLVVHAKEEGYVTTMFGRRRPVPELKSSNFMQRSFGERVAMNSPIQGTAADIIKIAMIHVNERLKKEKLKSRLILQVHDELLIEADRSEVEEVQKILSEEMHRAADLSVPLEIDMHEGENWYEAK